MIAAPLRTAAGKRRANLTVVLLCAALGISVGCAGDPAGTDEARESAAPSVLLPTRVVPTDSVVPGGLATPVSMTTTPSGEICIADTQDHRAVLLAADLGEARVFGSRGPGPGELQRPVVCNSTGDDVLVVDQGNGRLTVFDIQSQSVQSYALGIAVAPSPVLLSDGTVISPASELGSFDVVAPGGRGRREISLPGEVCLPDPPHDHPGVALLAASPRFPARLAFVTNTPCSPEGEIPVVAFDLDGAFEVRTTLVDASFRDPEQIRRRARAGRRRLEVAAIAITEERVAILYATSGLVEEKRVTPLQIIDRSGHQRTLYLAADVNLIRGLIALVSEHRLLVTTAESFLAFDLATPASSTPSSRGPSPSWSTTRYEPPWRRTRRISK